jgi:hypothetical protein
MFCRLRTLLLFTFVSMLMALGSLHAGTVSTSSPRIDGLIANVGQ